MATFAVIKDNIVINKIVAETALDAETLTGNTCIEYTTEPIDEGWSYIDGAFVEPVQQQSIETVTGE
jgi:hypothetical protein